MKIRLKYIHLKIFLILLMPCLFSPDAASDTLILKDGTLLVGKVKEDDKTSITFRNYYGIFQVPRKQILKLYVTRSYAEDIAVRKKLGLDFNEAEIRKNYKAGLKKITAKERTQQLKDTAKDKTADDDGWGRLSIEGSFFMTMGELKDSIPSGMGGFISYDQGLDFITGGARHSYIPGIRIETGYLSFSKDDNSLSGYTASAGPIWMFPQWEHPGRFRFAVQPGISMMNAESANESSSTTTFTLHSLIGYEYPVSTFSFFINARYMYIYDKDVLFQNAGVSAGISFRLW